MHSYFFLQFIQLSFYIFSLESNLFFTNFFLNNLFFHFVDLNLQSLGKRVITLFL